MNKFKGELCVRTFSKDTDELIKSFTFVDETGEIVVPKGFVTDYASVPRILLPIVPKIGKNRKAAVIHDWLYSSRCKLDTNRKAADKVFLRALKSLKVSHYKRRSIYFVVRLFGGRFYKRDHLT